MLNCEEAAPHKARFATFGLLVRMGKQTLLARAVTFGSEDARQASKQKGRSVAGATLHLRLACKLLAYEKLPFTVVKAPVALAPRVGRMPTAAIESRATSRAYSMIVAPDSSLMNDLIMDMV